MYSVRLGYDDAVSRIKKLGANGHHAEALVTSVFTLEKTIRRSLRYMIVARGFTSRHAELLLGRKGFDELRKLWPCFERHHRPLADIVGNNAWQPVPEAVQMRNKLIHGARVYDLEDCKARTGQVLAALDVLRTYLQQEIGFDGWSRTTGRRKPRLAWLAAGKSK